MQQVNILKLVMELIDESGSLNASAPVESNRTTEFITKMTAAIVLGSLARCILNATNKSGDIE